VRPHQRRALVSLATLLSGAWAYLAYAAPGSSTWDAGQFYVAVRTFIAGGDPYDVVARQLPFPLFYPFPALLLFAPFAVLPEAAARVAWAMLQGGVFAWAAARHRPVLLIALLSASYIDATILGHYAPLLTAAALVPALGFLWSVKPTLGLALFAAFPTRAAVVGVATTTLISLMVMPGWPPLWLEAVRQQIHTPPVLRPGGALLLLSLLRWRHPEARLLAAYSVIPISTGMYDTLPLFLIPQRRRDAYVLAALTLVASFLAPTLTPWRREEGQLLMDHLTSRWPLTFVLVYLPVLLMVLRLPALAPTQTPTPAEPAAPEPVPH